MPSVEHVDVNTERRSKKTSPWLLSYHVTALHQILIYFQSVLTGMLCSKFASHH